MMKNMLVASVLLFSCNPLESEAPSKEATADTSAVVKAPVAPAPAPKPATPAVKLAPKTVARLQELNRDLVPLFKTYNAAVTKWNDEARQALKPLREVLQPLASERFNLIVKVAEHQQRKPECYIVFATGDAGKQCQLDGGLWDIAADGQILTQ